MQLKSSALLTLLLVLLGTTHNGVQGVSLFNFWSHILPGTDKSTASSPSENSVIPNSAEDVAVHPQQNITSKATISSMEIENMSSEESRLTQLLNPMSWFKKTKKENSFEINAELGTVRPSGQVLIE